jgi:Protein of unknown function (DUF2946)
MDEQVKQAMARWPNVPAMFGWLRLDRRGKWYLIDRGNPGFDAERDALGSSITSPSIIDFIARNYQPDDSGRWFWQNGPQRVFVDLDVAPLIFRVFENATGRTLVTHCGDVVSRIDALASTPAGELWLRSDLGPGVVHDLDLAQLDIESDADHADESNSLRLKFAGHRYPIDSLASSEDARHWAGFEPQPRSGSTDAENHQ